MLSCIEKRIAMFQEHVKDVIDADVVTIQMEKFFNESIVEEVDPIGCRNIKKMIECSRKLVDREYKRCRKIYKVLKFFKLVE